MKILVDTSIIVEIDRGNKEVTNLLKKILENHELIISTITVGEILTGSHLNKNQNEENFASQSKKTRPNDCSVGRGKNSASNCQRSTNWRYKNN